MELKNRCFKDMYNILEDAVYKFYDLFTTSLATSLKNEKLEETFQ